VLPRAEALAALMTGRRGVAVAGTHGKTTTTSMLTVAVQHCGVDPSFAIGGDLNEAASNAHHGSGELFVVEADESDGSFLAYRPYAAIVTNVEPDHLDHYGDAAAVDRAFEDFVTTIEPAASWSPAPTTRARSGWPSTPGPAAPTSGPTARPRTPTSGWTR
jgi:UDP-N-acetylmuramate--alanine ligase